MYPHTHFLFALVLGLCLKNAGILSGWQALACAFFAVAVDIDHYIEHIILARKHRFSIIRTWNDSVVYHHFRSRSFVHHWPGLLSFGAVFLLLSFLDIALAAALATGYYSHMLLDRFHLKRHPLALRVFGISFRETVTEGIIGFALLAAVLLIW